jgi:membrane-bound lytic murein transglycosylase D
LAFLGLLFSCGPKQVEQDVSPTNHAASSNDQNFMTAVETEACRQFSAALNAAQQGHFDEALSQFDDMLSFTLGAMDTLEDPQALTDFYQQLLAAVEMEESLMRELPPEADEAILDYLVSGSGEGWSFPLFDNGFFADDEEEYDLPMSNHLMVQRMLVTFGSDKSKLLRRGLERSTAYLPMILEVLQKKGMPLDLAYLPLIESAYKVKARSRANAVGMWQFVKGTAQLKGLHVSWWVDERMDPRKSTEAAADYLQDLYERYHDWYLALAAYNAGPGRVDRALKRSPSSDYWTLVHKKLLPPETRRYVAAFLAGLRIAKYPQNYGFFDLEYELPQPTRTISVPYSIALSVLAGEANLPEEVLIALNPALLRRVTAGDDHVTELRVPYEAFSRVEQALTQIPPEQRLVWQTHRLKRGEVLGQLARRYGVPVDAIMTANGIRNPRRIREGTVLRIPQGLTDPKAMAALTEQASSLDGEYPDRIRIRKGQTLSGIAKEYRTSVASLLRLNPGVHPRSLRPGQELKLKPGDRRRHMASSDQLIRVRSGDSLSRLAARHKTTVLALCQMNGLTLDSTLFPGQQLKVPPWSSPSSGKIVHNVRHGDTLYALARHYRVPLEKLFAWNALGPKSVLKVGQEIVLYRE